MDSKFNMKGKIAIVTGGGGVLGSAMAFSLAKQGVITVIIGRNIDKLQATVNQIITAGGEAIYMQCDVLNTDNLESVKKSVLEKYGQLDILINAAGGNMPGATISPEQAIFDLQLDALQSVIDLNIIGTILPSKVFSEIFAKQKSGIIINISSTSAQNPLSRVVGYSASKAAIENFTKWLAVELAGKYGDGIRVNAIAPGFFIGEQNKNLLLNPNGELTARGEKIIAHTPMKRFGNPQDLEGALLFLASDLSIFITGIVIPVDGGFAATSI
ncbi:SDR family oxidoreductase [Flavobacterium sp.]|uniref:SDR family oxidoreductase n=1 Tax=Flavobacterium sp. TaxID=239 RepID=UPI00286C799F|nr:SDR family oxidoreductase [Flavobacterium sp.]